MTRPIDEKIVVMKLDNSDFTKKAAETTTVFGRLRNTLNKIPGVELGKTTQELGAINKEAGSSNVGRLAEAVQNVSSKFSTLNIVATTALATVTNQAVNAGVSLAKSLSLDQVISGFQEYETKIGSIATVLSNTQWAGTNLQDINRVLADLNNYADKTIYNFGQMTENIGRFTAAGVKVDDAAIAIKGLGNLAAASGSNTEQLNTAMYQMSQALAAGKLNLMDWNSLVNAGMAGKKTQDALVETARSMGKNVDLSNGFRDSIHKGWLTSEVFLATLKKFGKDKSMTEAATSVRTFSGLMDSLKESIGSGWATTFEQIFGDFTESTKLFTGLSQAVGGWFQKTANERNKLIKGVADKGGMQNIFSGIQNAVKPVIQVFGALSDGFRKVFPPTTVNQVVKMTKSFKEFTAGLTLSKSSVNNLTTIFQGVFSVFSTVWEIVKKLGGAFANLIPKGTGSGILGFLASIAKIAIAFNESVKSGNILTKGIDILGRVLKTVGNVVKGVLTTITDFGSSLKNNLGNAIDWLKVKLAPIGKFLKDAFSGFGGTDVLGAGTLIGVAFVVKKIIGLFDKFGGTFDTFKEAIKSIGEGVGGVFDNLGGALKSFQEQVKYNNLLKIAIAVGILAASLKLLEGMSIEDITKGITALGTSLGVMMAGLAIIDKFNMTGGMRASITIIALATSVAIMAGALKKIADLNPQQLITGIGGLVGIVIALSGAIIAISKWGGKIKTSSLQLIALAGAIYILADSVSKMSSIDAGSLFKSIGALGLIFAELAVFLKIVDRTKFGVSSAIGILAIAGSLQIMVSAIQKISGIDVGSITKGLITIAIILGEIAIFSKVSNGASLLASGVGLVLLAAAINALVNPIQSLGNMSWEQLVKGLGGMAIALGAVAMAAILASGSIGGAVAISIIAGALMLLVIPMKQIAEMTWGDLIKSFVGLAGGITILAAAAILLTPATPSMLAFGAGLLLMGAAVLAAGVGIALFGTGLATLATMTTASIAAIVSALSLLIKGLGSLIPAVAQFAVTLGLALIKGLATLIPALANAVSQIIIGLLTTITTYLPRFIDLGTKLIVELIDGMGKAMPNIINATIKFMVNIIDGMTNAIQTNGPKLVSSMMGLIGEILIVIVNAQTQMVNALFGWIPGIQSVTGKIGKTAENYIRNNFGAKQAGSDKGKEFANALSAKSGDAKSAGSKVGKSGKDGVNSANLATVGGTKGAEFAKALGAKASAASSSGRSLATSGKGGADSVKMTTTGQNFGSGFANGISSKLGSVISAAKSLAEAAANKVKSWLDIHSPSRVMHTLGQHTGQGFANGIAAKKKAAAAAAKKAAAAATKGFNTAMSTASYKFKMHKINSTQYIAEIKKIKSHYAKYPALVQKANLEIKKQEDVIAKAKEAKLQAQFDKEKKVIDDKKYYNQLSLADELKAWEKSSREYKKGTQEKADADREVYRVKNEINKKLIDLNDEYTTKINDANQQMIDGIKALNDEYNKAVDDRTRALTGFAGIFDKIDLKSNISGQTLIDNLSSQVTAMTRWSYDINVLAKRGIDQGLLEELRQMGPQAQGEISALSTMTDQELTAYQGLWRAKNKTARDEALVELEGLKTDTQTKITELQTQTAIQLETYKTEWIKKIQEIKTGTTDEFVSLNTSMQTIGTNSIKGLIKGMDNTTGLLLTKAKSIADSVSATIKKALQIHSPSRVAMGLGEYFTEGLAVGIGNKTKSIIASSKSVAMTAKDSLNKFLDGFDLSNVDNEIHFKAVIDYNKFDPNQLGLQPVSVIPDISFTNSNASAVTAMNRQNNSNNTTNSTSKNNSGNSVNDVAPKQPVTLQLALDGRVVAEQVYPDINNMLSRDSRGAMRVGGIRV